ncbi:MAG: SDR family oxidoreductase [Betaproteobacteria bacterium]|nr:SDR family oxidoreductase [Betaproteobacteria bacterium]
MHIVRLRHVFHHAHGAKAFGGQQRGLVDRVRHIGLGHDLQRQFRDAGVFRNQPESFVQKYCAKTPLGRMAKEEDFKGAIAYLCSDMSAYVTGHNLVVDGGWTIW